MKPSILLVTLLAVHSLSSARAAAQVVSEDVTFIAGGRTIPGTIVHPGSGKGPGLLLLAGSGPTDRDWNSALLPGRNGSGRLLAESLAARGITVLRFDKAFSGRNPGLPITELSLDTYRDEATAAIELLRSRPEVDASRLFVAGHSEGGIHATRLAQALGAQLRGVILISAPGRSLAQILEEQLEKNVLGPTLGAEQAQVEMGPIRTALRAFVAGEAVDPKTVSSRPQVVGILSALMAPPVARIGRALASFDPAQGAASIAAPVLVLQGGKDVQVDPLDAERLVTARRSAGKPVDHFLSPMADHVLKEEPLSLAELRASPQALVAKYNAPDRVLAGDLVERLVGWIRER